MTPKNKTSLQGVLTVAYLEYQKSMHKHAYAKVNNVILSEDLVQDTFLKTWKYLSKGGDVLMMKAFLYHILNNLIIDEYRKHKTVSLDVMIEAGFDIGDGADEVFFNILDGKIAMLLMRRLPKVYQRAIVRRYVEGLSLKEISLITGQTQNAVAVQVHRGIEKLKVLYNTPPTTLMPYHL